MITGCSVVVNGISGYTEWDMWAVVDGNIFSYVIIIIHHILQYDSEKDLYSTSSLFMSSHAGPGWFMLVGDGLTLV